MAKTRKEIDWKKVKTEYITSDKSSYRKLSEKYEIPLGTLYKRAKRENWVKLKQQSGDRTVAKTVIAIEEKKVDRMKRIQDITDRILDKIEKSIEELDIQLYKDVRKEKVIEYNNLDRPDKPTKEIIHEEEKVIEVRTIIDRKGVQELASAIKSLKEVQMLKTELDEEEQKARIDKLRKECESDQGDTELEVTMGEEVDEYAN